MFRTCIKTLLHCGSEQNKFIVEANFWQKSIHAAQLQFKERTNLSLDNVWFSDEAHFLLPGHVNSKNNIFWGSTPPEHSLQRPLHSVKCTALDHSGSRTTTSGFGQHLVDGEGSSGSSSGSSRMVPPPTPQTNHWHGYSSVSLTDLSAAGLTHSGRRIHRTWTPQIFIWGDTLRTWCIATTLGLSLTWRQQSQEQ